jgi:hypothetical protein
LLGENFFSEVASVTLWFSIPDRGMESLKPLARLQHLNQVETKITDAGLVHLECLAQLQTLNLMEPNITDAGLVASYVAHSAPND